MSKFIKYLSFLLIVLFTGCIDNKVDASSDKALKRSIEDIRKSLPSDKLKEFNEALTIVMFKDFDFRNTFLKQDILVDLELSKAKANLANKTADEIIAESKIIKKDKIIKRKEDLKEKINVLEEKKQKTRNFEDELNSKIQVSDISFNLLNNTEYSKGNISFNLSNNMDFTISSVEFELKFISPNRDVPWTTVTLYKSISGGIMPNEKTNIETYVSTSNIRGNKLDNLPSDAVPVISITSIYNSSNKKIKEQDSFSNWDESQLQRLKKEYESI